MNIKFPFVASKSGLHNGVPWVASLFLAPWRTAAASNGEQMADLLPWLFGIPGWLLFIALMGAFAGLALLALAAYRRWLAPRLKRAPGRPDKRANYYVAATGAVVGIVVGLLLADYWEAYVSRMIAGLPPTAAGRIEPPKVRGEDLTPEVLADLLDKNPAEALRLTLPEQARAVLPPATQDVIEGEQEMEGTLQILHLDYKDPSQSHYVYRLKTDMGEEFSLHFATPPREALTGSRVRAKGLMFRGVKVRDGGETEGAVGMEDGNTGVLILEAGGSTTTTTTTTTTASTPPVLPNTFGAQNVAVILVNFQSAPSNMPWSADQARSLVFGTVSDFFVENSYGQTSLTGDVFGWFTIAVDPAGCPTMNIASAANQAAEAQGIDLSGYGRIVYAFPDIGCPWTGEATVGGQPSLVWLDGTLLNAGVVSHELGHNFGLFHSHAMDCGSESVGGTCTTIEYGDAMDRMGNTITGHFNAFQKTRLGWLDHGTSPPVITAEEAGVFQLEPYAAQTQGAKAIRILRETDPATGLRKWYFLEFRQALGFDSFLTTSKYGPTALNGIVFRIGTEGDGNSSFLLDTSPLSQTSDWLDFALPVGSSYTDSASGATVAVDQISASGATISLSFGQQQQCAHGAPIVALSPSQSASVPPGTLVSFSVSVTNKDSAACANATFDLAGTVPAGWASSLVSSSLTLAPGTSGSTTLGVTSAATAAGGSYGIAVNATERGNTAFSGSGAATYVVAASNHPPAAKDDSAATNQGTAVAVTVVSNDSDPDGDPLSLVAATKPANGNVTFGTGGALTYTPTGTFAGTDAFSYTVSDGRGGTASATVTVTVKKVNTRRK